MAETRLSQAAPTMPTGKKAFEKETYGVSSPLSAATIPSVYNKKLSKLFRGRLAVLPGDFTVAEAMRRMARYNISSVPVTKSRKDSTVLGFVDMLDFLAYLCKLVGKEGGQELIQQDLEALKSKTDAFKNAKIRDLIDFSKKNPFYVLNGEECLADAVQQYLKGVHRIAIADENGDVIGVVSQWTIANYLATVPTDDKEWIPTLREPLERFKCVTTAVQSVNFNEMTINCFLKMHSKNVSSLAVLDDSGKLWGNLSASDLKGFQLFLNDFGDLMQPVKDFLSLVRKRQGRPENFAIGVTKNTPVKDIVEKFNEEIIHRVFVVDDDFKPTCVFSLTNLLEGLIVDTHTVPTFAKATAIPPSAD